VKQHKAESTAEPATEPIPEAKAVELVEKTAHVQSVEDELRQKLAVKFEIKVKGKDKGQIVIGFESNDDFERVIETLRR